MFNKINYKKVIEGFENTITWPNIFEQNDSYTIKGNQIILKKNATIKGNFQINNKDNFIIITKSVTLDGLNNIITVNKDIEYKGLVILSKSLKKNSKQENNNDVVIKNIKVKYLSQIKNSGGICKNNFTNENKDLSILIKNCRYKGSISTGGGIIGNKLNLNTNCKIKIEECRFVGEKNKLCLDLYSGGIIGNNAGIKSVDGYIEIKNCYTNCGIINSYSGGLVGSRSNNLSNGILKIISSYTKGYLKNSSGGIIGSSCNFKSLENSNILIENCFFNGNIYNSGGLVGSSANEESWGDLLVNGCYSIGTLLDQSSSLIANYANEKSLKKSSESIIIKNCFGMNNDSNNGSLIGITNTTVDIIIEDTYTNLTSITKNNNIHIKSKNTITNINSIQTFFYNLNNEYVKKNFSINNDTIILNSFKYCPWKVNTYIRNTSAPLLDKKICINEREYKKVIPNIDPFYVEVDDNDDDNNNILNIKNIIFGSLILLIILFIIYLNKTIQVNTV